MRQRQRSRLGPWALVLLCVGCALLPAGLRRAARDRLLVLHARLAAGVSDADPPAAPAERARSNRIRLLESQVLHLQQLLDEAGAAPEVVRLEPEADLIPADAFPLAGAADHVQRVVINRGRLDGIRAGLPVLAGDALVGTVAAVSPSTSEVRLVTDPTFTVRATIRRPDGEELEGLVRGDGSGLLGFEPALLDEAAPTPVPREGETLLCSRQSVLCGVPALVGAVVAVEERPGASLPLARVLPAVDVGRLERLVVVRRAEAGS